MVTEDDLTLNRRMIRREKHRGKFRNECSPIMNCQVALENGVTVGQLKIRRTH